jgi:hypothetical protein
MESVRQAGRQAGRQALSQSVRQAGRQLSEVCKTAKNALRKLVHSKLKQKLTSLFIRQIQYEMLDSFLFAVSPSNPGVILRLGTRAPLNKLLC